MGAFRGEGTSCQGRESRAGLRHFRAAHPMGSVQSVDDGGAATSTSRFAPGSNASLAAAGPPSCLVSLARRACAEAAGALRDQPAPNASRKCELRLTLYPP